MKKIWIIPVLLLSIGLAGCSMFGNDGDDDDDGTNNDSFIVGYWVQESLSFPDSNVYQFASGGTCTIYDDYAMTTVDVEVSWSLSGETLTIMGITGTITKVSENEFQWNTELGSHAVYYRKGYEPDGFVFDGPSTALTLGTAYDGNLTAGHSFDVLTVAVEDGADYKISWEDDYDGSGSYSADIEVTAYAADKLTTYFADQDLGYSFPSTVTAEGATIYIVVHPSDYDDVYLGTYSLKVTKVTP